MPPNYFGGSDEPVPQTREQMTREQMTQMKGSRKRLLEEERGGSLFGRDKYYDDRSVRQNKSWNGMAAPFVDKEDQIPLLLLHSLQTKKPWRNYQGFQLLDIIQSDEIMVWADEIDAIICFVGQNIATNSQHLIDDLNVAGIVSKSACQLRLVKVGKKLIDQVFEMGLVVTLCGYSLGGSTVGCLSDNPKVDRGITFNAGAPLTHAPRLTPSNCTDYHIVGDILSTHFTQSVRIYLIEAYVRSNQTDKDLQRDGIQWLDVAYYHSLDRFLDLSAPYEIVNAQFEQNSLENYLFFKRGDVFDVLGSIAGILSSKFNFRRKLQTLLCSNPIPGAVSSLGCEELESGSVDKLLGGVVGGLAGLGASLVTTGGANMGPATVGGASIGASILSGKKGILDYISPDLISTVEDVGEQIVDGAYMLDTINTKKGVWTSQIVEGPPPEFAQGGLLQKIK